MIDFVRVCAGRAGVGAWRSKKQFVWAFCILVGFFLLYVQFSPSQINEHANEAQHRSLHSASKPGQIPLDNLPSAYDRRVRFIKKEAEGGVSDTNHGIAVGTFSDGDPPKDQEYLRNENIERNFVDSNRLGDSQNNFQYANQQADALPQENAIDNSWNNAPYKYNSFGEPVYAHGNHPNYIPKHRIVHFDLKGAPIKFSVFKTLLPWLAELGATGVLLEYEEVFPYTGRLSSITAKNHYTESEIKEIVQICRKSKLEVIPLVQTFGHLEFALKGQMFSHLREVPEIPQALCPSLNDSMWFIHTMIDQMMSLHKGVKYLHIGCDEVWQMGECERCRMKTRESIFINHVSEVAKYVRSKHNVIPIIWHDMLVHVPDSLLKENNFGSLVEPMVWVYAEDIYRFVQPSMWSKFGEIFDHVWAASAFKGAFMEQGTVPNVRRHLDNNLNWLDVMAAENGKFRNGFRGITITGWQRFDHFAILCELFPAALPSLATNLIATTRGFFNSTVEPQLYKALNCMQTPKYQTSINLDADPFLWDKFSWCFFPGALVFKVTARLDAAKKDVENYIEHVEKQRGWITTYNRRHNYSSPTRVDEELEELPSKVHSVTLLLRTAKEALSEWFDDWTVGEWIELHIWPLLEKLETIRKESEALKLFKTWPNRPLPLLKELEQYGIFEPKSSALKEPNSQNKPLRFKGVDNE